MPKKHCKLRLNRLKQRGNDIRDMTSFIFVDRHVYAPLVLILLAPIS